MERHHLEERVPRQGALELKQRVVGIDLDRNRLDGFACLGAGLGHKMAAVFPGWLLVF